VIEGKVGFGLRFEMLTAMEDHARADRGTLADLRLQIRSWLFVLADNASSKTKAGRASNFGSPSSLTRAISAQSRALKGVSGVMRVAESTPVNHT